MISGVRAEAEAEAHVSVLLEERPLKRVRCVMVNRSYETLQLHI